MATIQTLGVLARNANVFLKQITKFYQSRPQSSSLLRLRSQEKQRRSGDENANFTSFFYNLTGNIGPTMDDNTTSWNLTNNTNGTGPGPNAYGWLPRQMTTEDIVYVVFYCMIATMIVFGNSLVIGAFRVNRRLRTATNLLLMSLAIADMLVGLITVPLWVYIFMYYNVVRSVLKFYKMFNVIFVVSSILHLTAVTLERCYALVWPIKHRNIRRRKSV